MGHGIVRWDGQWDTRVSVKGTGGHPVECSMGSWDGMDSGTHAISERDRWTSRGMSHNPWDHGMGWTGGYTRICVRDRWTSHRMSQDPMG